MRVTGASSPSFLFGGRESARRSTQLREDSDDGALPGEWIGDGGDGDAIGSSCKRAFVALNGGPGLPFGNAVSLMVNCESQEEIDHYWEKLAAEFGGEQVQCDWLKDKFGMPWQIVPSKMWDGCGTTIPRACSG